MSIPVRSLTFYTGDIVDAMCPECSVTCVPESTQGQAARPGECPISSHVLDRSKHNRGRGLKAKIKEHVYEEHLPTWSRHNRRAAVTWRSERERAAFLNG